MYINTGNEWKLMTFKNGLTKAITFSFDDGNIDDIRDGIGVGVC